MVFTNGMTTILKNNRTTFIEFQTIFQMTWKVEMSFDGTSIFLLGGNSVSIYTASQNGTFVFNSTVSVGFITISFKVSSDLDLMIIGKVAGQVLIYKNQGELNYTLLQSINDHNSAVYTLSLESKKERLITGANNEILIYNFNGIDYDLVQTLNLGF